MSDRNGFNYVPDVRTFFLVFHDTTMVSKVSQKKLKYVGPKGTNLEILTFRNFGVPLGAHTLFFVRKPALPMLLPKKDFVGMVEG